MFKLNFLRFCTNFDTRFSKYRIKLMVANATKTTSVANIFDPSETPSNSASHQVSSYLQPFQPLQMLKRIGGAVAVRLSIYFCYVCLFAFKVRPTVFQSYADGVYMRQI